MVDYIITYVNNKESGWKNTFIQYCREHNLRQYIHKIYNERYSGTCWLPYHLKLVKKNMPFVNKVFVVVSNKAQLKGIELTDNVVIVEHKDFIPNDFLPTFNSTTIEIFLPLIKGLSERFIYANDDMLPIGKLEESDFFSNDKVKINWLLETFSSDTTQFKYQCHNNQLYMKTLPQDLFKKQCVLGSYLRPYHSLTPMIKEHCLECFNLIYEMAKPYISAFRTKENINQYIYPLFEELRYGTLPSEIDFLYTELRENISLDHQIICVNLETDNNISKWFVERLKELCE